MTNFGIKSIILNANVTVALFRPFPDKSVSHGHLPMLLNILRVKSIKAHHVNDINCDVAQASKPIFVLIFSAFQPDFKVFKNLAFYSVKWLHIHFLCRVFMIIEKPSPNILLHLLFEHFFSDLRCWLFWLARWVLLQLVLFLLFLSEFGNRLSIESRLPLRLW